MMDGQLLELRAQSHEAISRYFFQLMDISPIDFLSIDDQFVVELSAVLNGEMFLLVFHNGLVVCIETFIEFLIDQCVLGGMGKGFVLFFDSHVSV